jgi:transcriptional regulator with XRE-family HTH domain
MVREPEVTMLAQRCIVALTPTVRELAEQLGVPYRTFRSWRAGIRSPSSDTLRQIAELADQRADVLRGLAVELRRAAGAETRHS